MQMFLSLRATLHSTRTSILLWLQFWVIMTKYLIEDLSAVLLIDSKLP